LVYILEITPGTVPEDFPKKELPQKNLLGLPDYILQAFFRFTQPMQCQSTGGITSYTIALTQHNYKSCKLTIILCLVS